MTRIDSFTLLPKPRAVALLACFALLPLTAHAQFETRASTPLPPATFSVAVGDFNGDGKLDFAATGDTLSIFLGNGDGTFRPGASYSIAADPVLAADFNGDGILDLVVSTPGSTSVEVLLGNGDGTFLAPISSPINSYTLFFTTGDFNGDHKMDLVVIDSPGISVLLGNGDGTFKASIDNASFAEAEYVAVGDFNNDHHLDVAVVGHQGGSSNFGILLGNGDGTLQDSLTYPLSDVPCGVTAADLNRDGNEDLAIGTCGPAVFVFLGDGNGSFGPPETLAVGGGRVVPGDFNQDGKMDLVAGWFGHTGAVEFLGNGDGTFGPAIVYSSGDDPALMGDLNGDHRPDLLLFGRGPAAISMLNTGPMQFSPSSAVSFPAQLIGTQSKPQTVTLTNTGTGAITIRSMKTAGAFQTSTTCGSQLATGASCSISAVFAPLKAGGQNGGVTLIDSASSKPQFIELYGSATAIETSPNGLQFAKQKVGTQSPPKVVTVTNLGSVAVTFQGVSINGTNNHDFIETNNCAKQTIAPQGSCTVTVTFDPSITGPESGNLHIRPDKGTVGPAPLPLRGTGD